MFRKLFTYYPTKGNLNFTLRHFSPIKQLNLEGLKKTFDEFNKPNHYDYILAQNPNISKLKRCSILVPITLKQEINKKTGELHQNTYFTLTQRPDTIKTFKGQVCFVGGKRDEIVDHDDIATALREAKEEINIDSTRLTILAQLCPIMTTNGDLVTPIVAYFDETDYKPILNPDEVNHVFKLPTERFLSKENYSFKSFKSGKTHYYVHYFEDSVNGKQFKTWGFTAVVSVLVSSMLHSKLPEYMFDPEIELTNENKSEYLDMYLDKSTKHLKKSNLFN
jgi:8-oxo-dGTP pyrophosphatase MutT (NUDIX family)